MCFEIDEQHLLHGTLDKMESPDQQELRYCDNCREMFFTKASTMKCLECSITTIHDDSVIQFPDKHFYDHDDIDTCNSNCDLSDEQIDSILNLDSVEISEILTQDDPPHDLYLLDDDETREIPDDADEDTAWMIYYGDEIDDFNEYWNNCIDNFSIYEHFGIPDDIDSDDAEGLLEAAIPDR